MTTRRGSECGGGELCSCEEELTCSEYLTGFSKRKKQRIEGRKKRAQERDKEAHKEEVRKARKELRERAAQNVKDVRQALGLPALEGEFRCFLG